MKTQRIVIGEGRCWAAFGRWFGITLAAGALVLLTTLTTSRAAPAAGGGADQPLAMRLYRDGERQSYAAPFGAWPAGWAEYRAGEREAR